MIKLIKALLGIKKDKHRADRSYPGEDKSLRKDKLDNYRRTFDIKTQYSSFSNRHGSSSKRDSKTLNMISSVQKDKTTPNSGRVSRDEIHTNNYRNDSFLNTDLDHRTSVSCSHRSLIDHSDFAERNSNNSNDSYDSNDSDGNQND